MAGLGFKDFQVGEVLTAADVDGYLMQQSVMRFADAGARGSALGTAVGTGVPLAEGMLSYLDDLNQVQVFDGTSWVATGKVLQVVSAVKDDTFTTTSTSFTDLTGLSVSITPSNASSKVLLVVSVSMGLSTGSFRFNVVRDSTDLFQPSGGASPATVQSYASTGSAHTQLAFIGLDSPATTAATTYKLQVRVSSGTGYVNRLGADADFTAVSSITAIEVAA